MIEHTELKQLLAYDQRTGLFTWRVDRWGSVKAGDAAGYTESRGYILIKINQGRYWAHRLAWFYVHGCWPAHTIDHIDRNKGNNAIKNLRDVTQAQNNQNKIVALSNNKLGVLGVCFVKGKYTANIKTDRTISLGGFNTVQEAEAAYLAAKKIWHIKTK